MRRLLCFFIAVVCATNAFAWGQKGHDVVAYIAECHLTPATAQKVAQVLNGHSLVYYANWLDNASHTKEFAFTKTWHYANVDEGFTYDTMPKVESGDVVGAINLIVNKIKSGTLSHEDENLYLRMLIHLVGDMHCPMHAGRKSDRGGNNVNVIYFGRPASLHSVWDSSLVESAHKWSYTEWQQQIDRLGAKDIAAIMSGSVKDWFNESHAVAEQIYAEMEEGSKISYDEVAKYAPIIELQFERGGLRLAYLLEYLYGERAVKAE